MAVPGVLTRQPSDPDTEKGLLGLKCYALHDGFNMGNNCVYLSWL
jgi:hypothetical protein